MSLSLKHIPCPAGNNCTAFQCIFGHARDQDEAKPPQLTDKLRARGHQDGEEPRKRLKVDQPVSHASVRDSPDVTVTHASTSQADSPPGELQTVSRPVSPPPLSRVHRSTDQSTTSPVPPRTRKASPIRSNVSHHRPPTAKAKAASGHNASETLNPRLLKSSPASHEIRLKLLKLLHHEYSRLNSEMKKDASKDERRLVLSDQDIIKKALDEEEHTATQKSAVYANVMKNKVMQYKRMGGSHWKKERTKQLQAQELKKGRLYDQTGTGNFEDVRKMMETGLSAAQEVQLLRRILTPVDGLSAQGYVVAVPSEEAINSAREGVAASKGWEKCCRCQQRFQVFPGRREEDGALTSGGMCHFHWGKTYVPEKATGDKTWAPKRYQCCGQEVGESSGCFTHDHHVYKFTDAARLAAVLNFAETPENRLAPEDRAVCFDCEMAYTVFGMELVRLTATSWPSGDVLLDVLVQPLGEILDLNSRFSGVWPDDLAQAEPWIVDQKPAATNTAAGKPKLVKVSSPEVARDLFFSLISPSTPLIGHGLENDLNAVRIVHPSLIDTVLLYPHKAGLPYRQSLKKLVMEHLGRHIQQDSEEATGHDSLEDARAAGELVRLKLAGLWKEMQRAGWKAAEGGGELVSPEEKNKAGVLTEAFIEAKPS